MKPAHTRSNKFAALLAVATLSAAALTSGAAYALRSANTNGAYQICADTIYLRNAPNGPAIDTLKGGTHFEVTSNAGGNWVHGYSYWAQKSGWLQNGWFC
ncbi:hypothetical protein OV203_33470 [Nannocystis sp. ILAH1]|uniref:hypothetical protein n=1 Tax=Nannocystis sp. ILAH1 TaxID=2996789 RepID=UPI00226F321E|nr:hypothetical protein [Nannocystis sp. ILAH1]MCY0992097.1 hypothetical protein [Nannocystis sp. ILAH1]